MDHLPTSMLYLLSDMFDFFIDLQLFYCRDGSEDEEKVKASLQAKNICGS